MIDQLGDVGGTLAKRWYHNRENIQAVEQVLAKLALLYLFLKIDIGGSDNPDIDKFGLGRTDTTHFALLQEP